MGKSSKPTIGFWYRVAYHHGLTIGPIDKFLEFRGGDKIAWQGVLSASGTISVNTPNLWGGEKDQGGIVGNLAVMFGEPTQVPNPYLVSVFGPQTAAWRGFATVAFEGGRYGAMNPYPQPASYKISRILQGWDGGTAWYPEKAPIQFEVSPEVPLGMGPVSRLDFDGSYDDIAGITWTPEGGVSLSSGGVLHSDGTPGALTTTSPIFALAAGKDFRISVRFQPSSLLDTHFNPVVSFANAATGDLLLTFGTDASFAPGQYYWRDNTSGTNFVQTAIANDAWHVTTFEYIGGHLTITMDSAVVYSASWIGIGNSNVKVYLAGQGAANDPSTGFGGDIDYFIYEADTVTPAVSFDAINPAHVLYESRTNGDMGREPIENINDASLRAAADKLYAEGFGICPKWDPAGESVEDFEQRICRLIGGSFSRSLEDGQWYLDLARGDYVLEDLPILTDDDILEFKEQPATFDSAINSVSVRFFDPQRKESIVTPPVRALGLVTAFGTIHQTYDYPEIPTADLAVRVALRELLTTTTPTRAFDLVTTRRPYAWRPDQYFRLQAPKRGIADMVCLVGEKQSGTLKSGAIKLKATQDIYSLPTTSFVQVEPGVDTRPPPTPSAIVLQRALEAPYIEVAASTSRTDLDALSADAGFAMAVAAAPAGEIDFTMVVAPDGGSFQEAGHGEWSATATVNEAAAKTDTDFTLAAAARLNQVTVGMGALWDDEIVRVDAIDAGAGTITLARGCADTVPVAHAADSRLWFYEVGFAYDATEFTDGETIDIKLLSNTGSQQLQRASATTMTLTFDQRQARPYPPGHVLVGGSSWPTTASGAFNVTWTHRDRVQQADQLVDTAAASIGPESTVRYGLRFENASTDALIVERTDLGGPAATVQLGASAPASVRMKLWAISDVGVSWQTHEHVFSYSGGSGLPSIDGVDYIPPPSDVIVDANDPPPSSSGSPPTPTSGGAGMPGTPTARTIGTTVVTPSLTAGSSAATANTAAINSAFASLPVGGGNPGGIVRIPAGDWYLDPSAKIFPVTNSAFDNKTNGATLRCINGGLSQGSSFTLHKDLIQCIGGVHDVEIYGGHLVGFREAWAAAGGTSFYTPGTSEWNHAVYIGDGAHNITVYDLTASEFGGDGVSIGKTAYNVHVLNVRSTNNRRQGISVAGISASANIKIEKCECDHIGGSDGTSPMAGIDCEVDNPTVNSTSGIQIIDCYLHHNTGPGLICYKSVNNITISDLRSEYNLKGIYGVDSDNVTITGATKLRYNKYEGLHLRGSCSSWSVRADFFDNKTKQYGAPLGSTTTTPTAAQKAKHITVESTVTGLSFDPTTTWGAI
jgi:hypothetical protein